MVLRGSPSTISTLLTDADGEPLAKDTTVTVAITRDSDGSSVVEGAEVKTDADGVASYELAAQSTLDRFTVTWVAGTATFTTVEESIGLRLCSLASVVEDLDHEVAGDRQRLARDIAEQFLEDECGVAFRPRYGHVTLDGSGTETLLLPEPQVHSLRAVKIDDATLTESDLEAITVYGNGGYLKRSEGWSGRVDVIYEHGYQSPPPAARRAAAILARHLATKRPSNLEDRATTYTTDVATYALIQPGIRGAVTALPEVNAFIESWQHPEIG